MIRRAEDLTEEELDELFEPYKNYGKHKDKDGNCTYCHDGSQARDCCIGTYEQYLINLEPEKIFGNMMIHTREINFCPYCGRDLRIKEER